MTTATRTLAILALAILPSCAGLEREVTLAPEDRVVVELVQPPGGSRSPVTRQLRQKLCSESVYDKLEFYSSSESDPLTKILDTEKMQLLLDAFATAGFYERATTRELVSGVTTLSVEVNDDRRVLARAARTPETAAADLEAFTTCWKLFIEVFNATPAYRSARGANSVLEQHELQRQSRGAGR